MPVSNDTISTDRISVEDVNSLLKESSLDVGTLCKSSKINRWSKHKPVKYRKVSELTDAEFKSTNYGLVVPASFNSSTSIPTAGWTYSQPTGGDSEPFRLTDFAGYKHNAEPPLGLVSSSLVWNADVTSVDNFTIVAYYKISGSSSQGGGSGMNIDLNIGDLYIGTVTDFTKCYWGLVYVNSSGNRIYCLSTNTFGNLGVCQPGKYDAFKNVLNSMGDNSSITVIPFISSATSGTLTNGVPGGTCWVFPAGGSYQITKLYTPQLVYSSHTSIAIYNGTALLGTMSYSSSSAGNISLVRSASSGMTYRLLCTYVLRSNRGSTYTASASQFVLKFASSSYTATAISATSISTGGTSVTITFNVAATELNTYMQYVASQASAIVSRSFDLYHNNRLLRSCMYYMRIVG